MRVAGPVDDWWAGAGELVVGNPHDAPVICGVPCGFLR